MIEGETVYHGESGGRDKQGDCLTAVAPVRTEVTVQGEDDGLGMKLTHRFTEQFGR